MKLSNYLVAAMALISCPWTAFATENLPQLPVPQVAILPRPGEFVITPWYTYNYWKAYWRNGDSVHINVQKEDGYDQNNGLISLQYGISTRFALDLTVGIGSAASRFFDPLNNPHTTLGILDTQLGVRFQALAEQDDSWKPNLTLRAGGIIEGTYNDRFPFAPGDGASGFEPSFATSKEIFDCGLGVYSRGGWRVRTENVPQTIFGSVGVMENLRFDSVVQTVSMHFGYVHLQDLGGGNIGGIHPKGLDIAYRQDVKEIIRGIEGGINCTLRNGWLIQYAMEYSMSGRNTPQKTLYSLYVSIPFNSSRDGRN